MKSDRGIPSCHRITKLPLLLFSSFGNLLCNTDIRPSRPSKSIVKILQESPCLPLVLNAYIGRVFVFSHIFFIVSACSCNFPPTLLKCNVSSKLVLTSVKKEISPRVATISTPRDPAARITAKGLFSILK